MQANVYTGFLTNKVKAFATKKGISPVVFPRRVIERAYPFVLASAMMFTACHEEKTPIDESIEPLRTETTTTPTAQKTYDNEWQQIYSEVINKYHLTQLKDKEPFSQKEIEDLLKIKDIPVLNDTNFNHVPANQENFWEIVKNGIGATREAQNCDTLTQNQKQEYKITAYKMLSQMSRIKGSKDEVDLTDYNNLKTFLYFEKLLKYKGKYEEILYSEKGIVDERNELVGRYYKDFEALAEQAEKYPGVEKFAKAFYCENDRFMLNPQNSAYANAISRQFLQQWLKDQNITDKELWRFSNLDEDDDCNTIYYTYLRGSTFRATTTIDARGQMNEEKYAPVGNIAIHETMHLLALKPASNEQSEHNSLSDEEAKILPQDRFNTGYLSELGPSLHSLVLDDLIYKKINFLPEDKVVDYGVEIKTQTQKIPLGELAVWFNQMEKKYPSKSIDKVLSQPEVLRQLDSWGGNKTISWEMAQQIVTPSR